MIDSTAFANAIRIVTVVELGVVGGLAIAVFAIYSVANKHIERADPTTRGVLTRHVAAISLSYMLLAAFAVVEIQGYYGSRLTYRTPIGFVAANFGVYALIEMLRFQDARLDRRDNIVHVDGTPDT